MSSTSRPSTPVGSTLMPSNTAANHPAYTLLSRAHSAEVATQVFTDKIKNKPLLLHPSTTATQDKRALRRHVRIRKQQYYIQHQRPRPLSAKEKRTLGIYDLKPEEIRYDIYKGLNKLWKGYILEVLGFTDKEGNVTPEVQEGVRTMSASAHGSLIASADFHGMEVEVVRSNDVGRVGLRGIVVRETRSTMVVVTAHDKVVRVMKSGCVFKVVIDLVNPNYEDKEEVDVNAIGDKHENAIKQIEPKNRTIVLELHGPQLEMRPTERAVRKFKWRNMTYL